MSHDNGSLTGDQNNTPLQHLFAQVEHSQAQNYTSIT